METFKVCKGRFNILQNKTGSTSPWIKIKMIVHATLALLK